MMQKEGTTAVRIGTRGSLLAIAQAESIASRLNAAMVPTQIILVSTRGDQNRELEPIVRDSGIFTRELQHQLVAGVIDAAVHSLKDLPTEIVSQITLAAVPPRRSVADVLVSYHDGGVRGLPPGGRIGTGSPRRRAQLLALRPDLAVVPVRGNVETRVAMVKSNQLDAVILAEAGLQRLGMTDVISEVFPPERFLPAPGQGALGIETRADDTTVQQLLTCVQDANSMLAVLSERSCLRALRGGCLAPMGAWARMIDDRTFRLDAAVLDWSGTCRIDASVQWQLSDVLLADTDTAIDAGAVVARDLEGQGARSLLESSRRQ